MPENASTASRAEENMRRISVAVASWLCGALEGMARDSADMTLAESLDSWLRRQKRVGQTLYTGRAVCAACGHAWECLVLSTDAGSVTCPRCGKVQEAPRAPVRANPAEPENGEELANVEREAGDIVARIAALNQVIKNYHQVWSGVP